MDTSTITACSNDYDFKYLFSRNLEAFGNNGDALLIITTSGNSKNIIEVSRLAKKRKIPIIGFLGNNGGKVKKFVDIPLIVKSKNTARIQEAHIMLGHFIILACLHWGNQVRIIEGTRLVWRGTADPDNTIRLHLN